MRLALLTSALFLLMATAPVRGNAVDQAGGDLDALIAVAFDDAYNLDGPDALRKARALVSAFPAESRAHRALAAVVWLDVIFRRGAVTVDHYMGGVTRSRLSLPAPPPALDAEFKQAVTRAIELATTRLREVPDDVRARYDLGSAYGLLASYQASVEGSTTSAFLTARKAFDAQERVLQQQPRMTAAGVVVGTYRYVVAGLGLPSRMFAYMMGFGGDKARGIALVESALSDRRTHVEAAFALVLMYSREGRHPEAVRLLERLSNEFPRNRILMLEQGAALLRAGRQSEGEAMLTRGLEVFARDSRPKIPGERALWLYKRGVSRLAQNHIGPAAADFRDALASAPEDWVRGRIRLALGKLSDLDGHRPDAVTSYRSARAICSAANDPLCVAEADRWMKARYAHP